MLKLPRNLSSISNRALFIFGLLATLLIQAAVPFLTVPTFGPALWATGFSQSFINESIFSIYARNFGLPEAAPIAFGLAGVWPAGLLIKLGLHPAEAYTTMAALWSVLGFSSAYLIGRHFSLSPKISTLAAVTWGTMPIIWINSGYTMTSIAMALFPFYILSVLHLFNSKPSPGRPWSKTIKTASLYLLACLISVFMDGYTFIMFAVGSSIFAAVTFIQDKSARTWLLTRAIPIHIVSFGLCYYLYTIYIGKSDFPQSGIAYIRSNGIDLSFFLIPPRGVHWLMDSLGLSIQRSEHQFFGNSTTWRASFCAPIILGSIWAVWTLRLKKSHTLALALCMLFGLYMSLGPSLRINSKRPEIHRNSVAMPAEDAIMPTGSAFISQHLPGFKHMRVPNRWLILGLAGSWGLILLASSTEGRRTKITGICFLGAVTLLNLPNIPRKLKYDISQREQFHRIERDFIGDLSRGVLEGEKVAFLPWGNDFLVNYAAARLKIATYNIGGDKNLIMARKHWPLSMRQFQKERPRGDILMEEFPEGTANPNTLINIAYLLETEDADAVVLPYVDLLWAAHGWPAPLKLRNNITPILEALEGYESIKVSNYDYYSTIRLSPKSSKGATKEIVKKIGAPLVSLPIFTEGWYGYEHNKNSNWRWSSGNSELLILSYDTGPIEVEVSFSIQSISERELRITGPSEELLFHSDNLRETIHVKIPRLVLKPGVNSLTFNTSTPPPEHPSDSRKLAFRVIDFSTYEVERSPLNTSQ